MKYKIVVEVIIDMGELSIDTLPYVEQPQGIAESYANMAIQNNNIGADSSNVISVEVIDED